MTNTLHTDPLSYWRELADGLDPFGFDVPSTEREYAACMLYCMRHAANGRRYGPRPRPGKRSLGERTMAAQANAERRAADPALPRGDYSVKHRDARVAVPTITNTPARGTAATVTAADKATNCQHDAEAAADAISRAWTYDREHGTPLAALAGALARSYGYRYAHHRTDRHFARADAAELAELATPEERGAVARAELAAIVAPLTDDERAAFDYARACWEAPASERPDGAPRSGNALRTMRRLARRAVRS